MGWPGIGIRDVPIPVSSRHYPKRKLGDLLAWQYHQVADTHFRPHRSDLSCVVGNLILARSRQSIVDDRCDLITVRDLGQVG